MKKVRFGKRPFESELIIFDKDGTLTDFKKTWLTILDKRIAIILDELKIGYPAERVKVEMYRAFGIYNDFIDPYGPFPYTPPFEDKIIFTTVLYSLGVPWQKAKNVASISIEKAENLEERMQCTELYDGVREVLEGLHNNDILISIATADLTEIANNILHSLGIYNLFDYVIGADMVERDKPDPEMIYKTVNTLNVDRNRVAFVGDTITDMEMGKRAGIGLVVGVLEGEVARKSDLEKDADVVINSVREIKVLD